MKIKNKRAVVRDLNSFRNIWALGWFYFISSSFALLGQTPTAVLSVSPSAFLGEVTTITASLDNHSETLIGYDPMLQLILPMLPDEGEDDGFPDTPTPSVAVLSATYLGSSVQTQFLGYLDESTGELVNTVTGETISGTPGAAVYLFHVPLSSIAPDQPAPEITILARMHALTPLAAQDLQLTGIFNYGNDPTGQSAAISGAAVRKSITPSVLKLSQSLSYAENETATGASFPGTWKLIGNIASDAEVTLLELTDELPDNFYVTSAEIIRPAGGTLVLSGSNPGQILTATWPSARGSTSNSSSEILVEVTGYVPELDAENELILDPATGEGTVSNDFDVRYNFMREGIEELPVEISLGSGSIQLSALTLALQNTVSLTSDTLPGGYTPDDLVTFRMNLQVSDYQTVENLEVDHGRTTAAGMQAASDILSDGLTFDATTAPSYEVTMGGAGVSGTFDAGNFSVVQNPVGYDAGTSRVTFDLSQQLIDDAHYDGDGVLTGAKNLSPAGGSGTTAKIYFAATIDEDFDTPASGDASVDVLDTMRNDVDVVGDSVTNSILVGDESASSFSIQGVSMTHQIARIYSVEGVETLDPSGTPHISPGDEVTFSLQLTLPTGDVEDLVLSDFVPYSMFSVQDVNGDGVTGDVLVFEDTVEAYPEIGKVTFGPADEYRSQYPSSGLPSFSVSVTNNSLSLDYGDLDSPLTADADVNEKYEFEIRFTLVAGIDELPDGFEMTSLARVEHGSTNGGSGDVRAYRGFLYSKADPTVLMGAVASSNPNGIISPLATPYYKGAGSVGTYTEGQAGDTVIFAITVQNNGSDPISVMSFTHNLPAEFDEDSLRILSLDRADGKTLYTSPGIDGLLSTVDEAALIAGTLSLDTSVEGNYLTGSVSEEGEYGSDALVMLIQATLASDLAPSQTSSTDTSVEVKYSDSLPEEGGYAMDTGSTTLALAPISMDKVILTGGFGDEALTGAVLVESELIQTATIGEIITYELDLKLPQGKAENVILTDTLPSGLEPIAVDGVKAVLQSMDATMLSSTMTEGDTDVGNVDITVSGQTVSLNFGTLTYAVDADKALSSAKVRLYALVVDEPANSLGREITNTAQLSWTGGSVSAEIPLNVVRPTLRVTTQMTHLDGGNLEAGSTVRVDITVQNLGDALTSSAAHDFSVTSLVLNELFDTSSVSFLTTPEGYSASTTSQGNGLLITYSGTDPVPGDEVVFGYSVKLQEDVPLPSSILQDVTAAGTSLPGTPDSGTESTESDSGSDQLDSVKPGSSMSFVSSSHEGTSDSPIVLTIGERGIYRIQVNLPHGYFPEMTVKNILPAGLDFVGNNGDASMSFPGAGYTFGGPLGAAMEARLESITDPDPTPSSSSTTDGSGDDITFNFASFTHVDDGDDSNNYFYIDIEQVVLDRSQVVGYGSNPSKLSQRAQVKTSLSASSDGKSNTIKTTVSEPKLEITKSFVDALGDAGDELEFILQVKNIGNSDAFQVEVGELLEGGRFKTDSIVLTTLPEGWTGRISPILDGGDGSLDRTILVAADTGTVLEVDETVEFRWKVQVNDDIETNSSFTTVAAVSGYNSLPEGQPGGIPTRQSSGEEDESDVTIDPASITLSLVSTSESDTPDDLDGFTRLTIGERVVLRVDVRLPEGLNTTPTFVIDPQPGLDFVGTNDEAGLAFPGSGFGNFDGPFGSAVEAAFDEVEDDDPSPESSLGLDGSGESAALVFLDVLNTPDRVYENNVFSFDFELVVTDEAALSALGDSADPFSVTVNGIGGSAARTFRLSEPGFDLACTMSAPVSGQPDKTTVTTTLENTGSSHAWEIAVVDILDPALFDVDSVSNLTASNGFSGEVTDGTVTFSSTAGLAVGESTVLTFDVLTLPDPVSISTRATIARASTLEDATRPQGIPERIIDDLYAEASISLPRLQLTKQVLQAGFDGSPAVSGDQLLYTMTVTNDGALAASGVRLLDSIPVNTTYVPDSLLVNGSPALPTLPDLDLDLGVVGIGESATVAFAVTVNHSLPADAREISNSASVQYAERSTVHFSDNDVEGHDPRGDDGEDEAGESGTGTDNDDPSVIPLGLNAELASSTLVFEDLKNQGWNDWDYNDLVLDVKTYYFINGDDQVERLRIVYQVIARGAQYDAEVYVNLPFSGAADYTTRYLDVDGSSLNVVSGSASDEATILVFDSTQDALPGYTEGVHPFGARTERFDPNDPGRSAVVDIVFQTPVDNPRSTFSESPHDTWLLVKRNNEQIHRVQYFGGNTQFVREGPLAWRSLPYVLEFDADFNWPAEMNAIWNSHTSYVDYIRSGRRSALDWWQTWDEDLIWVNEQGLAPHPVTPFAAVYGMWVNTELDSTSDSLTVSSLTVGIPMFASPVLRELQGNGTRDILVSSLDGQVHRFDHHGDEVTGWPLSIAEGLTTSPGVGDIDGDGNPDIVIGSPDGKVYAWELDGTLKTGFPVDIGGSIKSVCAVVDLDGDGSAEILVHNGLSELHVLDGVGAAVTGWPQDLGGVRDLYGDWIVGSSPVVFDAGLDGSLQIGVGSTASKVHLFNIDGSPYTGWPQTTSDHVFSSLTLVDINDDLEPEIVAASADGKIWAWDHQGNSVTGFPVAVDGGVIATLAAGELDQDGDVQLVVSTTSGKVIVLEEDGSIRTGWPKDVGSMIVSSPLLVDADGDGYLEVIAASRDNWLRGWTRDGAVVNDLTLKVGDWIESTPAAADIDDDGKTELVFASYDGSLTLLELDAAATLKSLPWPSFRGDRVVSEDAPATDIDGDHLPDAVEMDAFGDLDDNPEDDSDGDGQSNYEEWISGTGLMNAGDLFEMALGQGTEKGKIQWTGVPGRTYRIYGSEALGDVWELLGTITVSGEKGMKGWDEAVEVGPPPALRFYRIEVTR
ncbi:LruC domain-containing protein [Kiritimatiellaeota bacterium B1221]|nr:LruC domain-containing protein [Kiritimatiellaeota bacterium B1221]